MNWSNKSVIIYGCGLAGRWTYEYVTRSGGTVHAFIDSDSKKHGIGYGGVKVFGPELLKTLSNDGHLMINSIVDIQDNHIDLVKMYGKNYLALGSLLTNEINVLSYNVKSNDANQSYLEYSLNAVKMCHEAYLNPDILYMRSVDIMVTERCSLKCKDCSNLMQYYTAPSNIEEKSIFDGVSELVKNVDYIYEFRVIGGEPFVNREIYDIIDKLGKYKEVDRITLFTNATIPLDENKLIKLKLDKLSFSITHYDGLSKRTQEYKDLLERLNISYRIHPPEYWTDSGTIIKPEKSNGELKKQFSECCGKNLFTLVDDKIYRCPFAANLERVDETAIDAKNFIKVSETKSAIDDYLYKTEYLPACNYCKGRSYSSPTIAPAIQTRKVLDLPTKLSQA